MNFDREESVSKSFTPNEGGPADDTVRALRSEKEVSESGQGTEPIPGGGAGGGHQYSGLPRTGRRKRRPLPAQRRDPQLRGA